MYKSKNFKVMVLMMKMCHGCVMNKWLQKIRKKILKSEEYQCCQNWTKFSNQNAVKTACIPILTVTQSFQKWDSYR